MYRKASLLLIIFYLIHFSSSGQATMPKFYEIIKGDSVMMFYNYRHQLVEKGCSDFTRYTRVDADGNFNGYFEDVTPENELLGRGAYVHGLRHGYFELYHPSGKVSARGYFADGIPVGTWEYFHATGLPERTLTITAKDTLLTRYIDKEGNIDVMDGNGKFDGHVAGGPYDSIVARGSIQNGKPEGKWTSVYANKMIYCKEDFKNGKLVRGVFPNSMLTEKSYTHKSFLSTFFLPNYLNFVEMFQLGRCEDSLTRRANKLVFNTELLYADLRMKIPSLVEQEFSASGADYMMGDRFLVIEFSPDENGKAKNFKLLSGWGQRFYDPICASLRTRATFPARSGAMYFHLRVQFHGGYSYRYNYKFSRRATY